jgi:hypothetical protein
MSTATKTSKPHPGTTRVAIYVNTDDFRQFKSTLMLSGKTVSGWMRERIAEVVASKKK